MSAKKQTSLTSFFTPKNVKTTNVAPKEVALSNSTGTGKKRAPVFETPNAKKTAVNVVKMKIVESDSDEQENNVPMADITPSQSMDLSVFRSNDTTPIGKINVSLVGLEYRRLGRWLILPENRLKQRNLKN
jgi:hypothetical protein